MWINDIANSIKILIAIKKEKEEREKKSWIRDKKRTLTVKIILKIFVLSTYTQSLSHKYYDNCFTLQLKLEKTKTKSSLICDQWASK